MPYGTKQKALPITALERCGRVFLCLLDNRTAIVYADTMNTFKEGDRVIHHTYGEGVIITLRDGTGWPTVQFANGDKVMTSDALLSPVPKFQIGDLVSHPMHGNGTVADYDKVSGLYTVHLGAYRAYRALEHQIKVPVPEPKFNVRVLFTNGNEVNAGDKFQQHAESYLQNLTDWDTVESITINRVKG